MGIDIQIYAEIFDGERWRPAEPLVENIDFDPEVDLLEPRLRPQSLDIPRNRALFAILTETIAPTRGLPEDISPEVLAIELPLHEAYFRHSWLGLEELLKFDWHGLIVQRTGMVDSDVASLFKGNPLGFPYKQWPKGKAVGHAMWSPDGVTVQWRETPARIAGDDFMEGVLPKLKSFGPAESVRIVFWFDH
jgi:hypothetical protein